MISCLEWEVRRTHYT